MSGGSYNYLCFAESAEAIAQKRDELERMLNRLCDLPYARVAADETARLLSALNVFESRVRASEELREVWRAVEWMDSGDSGEEWVRTVARDFEDGILPRHGAVVT